MTVQTDMDLACGGCSLPAQTSCHRQAVGTLNICSYSPAYGNLTNPDAELKY